MEEAAITYVYDCGSLDRIVNRASLSREINEFADRLLWTAGKVDVMFISHFDFDHVSGIPELANRVRIARFVIPMIPGADRLACFAKALVQRGGADSEESLSFYGSFIADPAGTLGALADAPVFAVPPATMQGDGGNDREEADGELLNFEEIVPPPPESGGVPSWESVVFHVSARSTKMVRAGDRVWEWHYVQSMQSMSAVSSFVDALLFYGLIAAADDLDDPKIIEDLVVNKRAQLRAAYIVAVATIGTSFTLNMSSLMLYSGPPVHGECATYRARSRWVDRPEIGAWNPGPAWLGLGDADLRSKGRRDHVNDMFARRRFRVGTFAPSHHGSRRDWHASLLAGLGGGVGCAPTLVFGASGAWGHPHHEVLLEANEAGATTVIVGVHEESRWTESLVVHFTP